MWMQGNGNFGYRRRYFRSEIKINTIYFVFLSLIRTFAHRNYSNIHTMMKKKGIKNLVCCSLLMAVVGTAAYAGKAQSNVITKMADGTYVVNTTTLASDVKGYRSTTPLKIYIKNNKVEKVEALKNQETPKYFVRVKNAILNKWNGKKVAKAMKQKVDGVTGATMSSDAVKENVKRGLDYYQKNK